MGANQRSPIMEKMDVVLGELDNLQVCLGSLADYVSPYCTPATSEPKAKVTGKELEEAKAPLEIYLEEATAKVRKLQDAVNDLIARLR